MNKNTRKPQQKQATASVMPKSSRNLSLQMLIVFAAGFLLYINTFSFHYALDDLVVGRDNKFTQKGISGIPDILSHDMFIGFFGEGRIQLEGGRYRPLSQIFFAIEYQFFGDSPFIGHLFNAVYYGLLCVIILITLRKIFTSYIKTKEWYVSLPLLATIFFAAHPVHTEAVANIKGRDEIFTMIGAIAALYYSFEFVSSGKMKHLLLSGICFFLGLMSKETSITFVAIIPLTIYFFTKDDNRTRLFISMTPIAAAAFLFLIIRYSVIGFASGSGVHADLMNYPFLGASFGEKYATIFLTLWKYIMLLVFPYTLTHDYYPKEIPIIGWSDYRAFLPLIVYVILVAYSIKNFRKKDIIAYCILFFIITLSITSNLVINVGTFMNERFLFMPSLGFTIVLAFAITEGAKKYLNSNKISAILIVSALIVLAYSVRTITRNPVWKDDFTLMTHDVQISTNSAKCNVSASSEYLLRSQSDTVNPDNKKRYLEKALYHARKGVALYSKHTIGWIYYGNAFMDMEIFDSALYCYQEALKTSPQCWDAVTNLNALSTRAVLKNRPDIGIYAMKTNIEYEPKVPAHKITLSYIFTLVHQIDSAEFYLRNVLQQFPNNDVAYVKLGQLYGQWKNDIPASIQYLEKAFALNPNNVEALESLGTVYGINNQFDKSVMYFERAIKLNPNNPNSYQNLGIGYQMLGMKEKAMACFNTVAQMKAVIQR